MMPRLQAALFPFLFGGAFIEAWDVERISVDATLDFPSFSEGLSLRPGFDSQGRGGRGNFPSFSEGLSLRPVGDAGDGVFSAEFPFLFGGAFIEARYSYGNSRNR